ncbi:hypothetical protein [Actinomadura roseirufa]|uniref:hypothetical protein n=1 Tax=Actinomadura roseirufa TaxID=2094049 RepID=UPI0010416F65|nr:hypothetical protein [Actinomadura roseirufa]
MITLKAALFAASAVGAVAVGGGATWATTGSHQEAGLQSATSGTPAVRPVKEHVPGTVPTCLPHGKLAHVKVPGAKLPEGAVPQLEVSKPGVPGGTVVQATPAAPKATPALPKATPAVPKGTPGLPKATPAAPKATPALPKATPAVPKGTPGLPKATPAAPKATPAIAGRPGAPANLPACPAGAQRIAGDTPAAAPAAPAPAVPAVPAKPGVRHLPAVPALGCAKLTPAVPVGGTVEKVVLLPKGLHHVSTSRGDKALDALKICNVTQKWTGKAGQWLTVERLKTPAGMTEAQLRRALGLAETGGVPVTGGGTVAWQAPHNGGVLLLDPNGYALFVNGSHVAGGGLRDVTAALRQAK